MSRKFLCELNVLRKRVENGERIVYNSVEDIEPLDNEEDERLYDLISGLSPNLVFEYNAGFGQHLINLSRFTECDCVGSIPSLDWSDACIKHIGESELVRFIAPVGAYDVHADVILIDNDFVRMSHEELTDAIRYCKASNLDQDVYIVVRDSQLDSLDGFQTADKFSFDDAGEDEDGETEFMAGVFLCHRASSIDMSGMFVSAKEYTMPENKPEPTTIVNPGKMWHGPENDSASPPQCSSIDDPDEPFLGVEIELPDFDAIKEGLGIEDKDEDE